MISSPPSFFPLSRWRHLLTIAVLGFTAYASTLKVGFLWDDHVIIETNTSLQRWTWENVKHDFISDNTQGLGDNYYRPLQAFSHRMDYSLWRLNPLGYHASDLLVHIANALLLYLFVGTLGFPPLVAFMTACLFAVNPIGVEQFLVASGRTTPLSFFFSLSCILFLLREGIYPTLLGLSCFSLALLTKEIGVITPAWVALVFYFKREPWRRWWIFIPLAVLTALYLVLRNQMVHSIVGPLDASLLILFVTKVFSRVIWHFTVLTLWPWNLHSHRLLPHLSHVWFLYLGGLLGVSGVALWKQNRTALFCLGWVVLGLLPTIPVMIRGSFMLDHWGYPVALGILLPLSLVLAHGLYDIRPVIRRLTGCIFLGLIITWSLLVHLNVELRGTDENIYRWALRFTTSNPVKYNLAALLLQTGRPIEAIGYLEEVLAHYPDDPNTLHALALAYWATGQRRLALHILETFSQHHPKNALINETLQNLRARS